MSKERLSKAIITTLILVNAVSAAMIESDISTHKGDRNTEITINYTINNTITSARVKLFLNKYDILTNKFSGNIDETLIEYFDINPLNTSPITIKLNNSVSWFYRICMRLAANSNYYSDCDSGNQFLLQDDTPIVNNYIELAKEEIQLIAETPEYAYTNEEFVINATLNNIGHIESLINVYSYVHNSSTKISTGAWTVNKETVTLQPGASIKLSLKNMVNIEGVFNLTIRAEHGRNTDVKTQIKLIKKPERNVILNAPVIINDSLRITVSNAGNIIENLTVKTYMQERKHEWTLSLDAKRFNEEFINISNTSGIAYILLYNNKTLLDETSIILNKAIINHELNNTIEQFIIIANKENSTILSGNNTPSQEQSMEILLYSSIIVLSLTTLGMVLKKL